jgi:hypothetical protein
MKPSNLMIHAVVELVVLMAVVIYFQQKMSGLTAQVQKLGAVLQQQQGIIHRHEQLLAQLFPGAPMYFSPVVDVPTPPLTPSPPPPPPTDAAPPNMMPMVESLMGMLGTVMSVPPPPSPPAPRATITEVDLQRELEEELQELQEGRVEEEPAAEPTVPAVEEEEKSAVDENSTTSDEF